MSADLYSWEPSRSLPSTEISVVDETLRDGLQGAHISEKPSLDDKFEFLELSASLGVHTATIGFPASQDDSLALAKYICERKLPLNAYCLGRTMQGDVRAIVNIAQQTGQRIEAVLFVGSSPLRMRIENWDLPDVIRWVRDAVTFAKREGLNIVFGTEDGTRSHPQTLVDIYQSAIDAGAERIVIADTVGAATPESVKSIVDFCRNEIIRSQSIGLDWHGHNDRGLSVANALQAAISGADRIHATALGIGERTGNTPMHTLVVNLVLSNLPHRLHSENLLAYSAKAASMCNALISSHEPIIGSHAFTTEAGIHAAAIFKTGDDNAAGDKIYSAVPASIVGRKQEVVVGPNSGESCILMVARQLDLPPPDPQTVQRVLEHARSLGRQMTAEEVRCSLRGFASNNLTEADTLDSRRKL